MSDASPTQQIYEGTEIAFSVVGFKNPITTAQVDGFEIYTAVKSDETGEFFEIDRATTSI